MNHDLKTKTHKSCRPLAAYLWTHLCCIPLSWGFRVFLTATPKCSVGFHVDPLHWTQQLCSAQGDMPKFLTLYPASSKHRTLIYTRCCLNLSVTLIAAADHYVWTGAGGWSDSFTCLLKSGSELYWSLNNQVIIVLLVKTRLQIVCVAQCLRFLCFNEHQVELNP